MIDLWLNNVEVQCMEMILASMIRQQVFFRCHPTKVYKVFLILQKLVMYFQDLTHIDFAKIILQIFL